MCCCKSTLWHGLKSAGASWRSALADVLAGLGYQSTMADLDVWIRKAVRNDGFEYYEMLFVHVDDIMSLSHCTKEAIEEITQFYKAKDGSIKEPNIYLSVNISKIQLPDGCEVWASSPRKYVKNAVEVVEQLLQEDGEGYVLKSRVKNPFPLGYKPELDITNELDDKLGSHYMQIIGILQWAVELGRIDIFLEVSLLSQYQANP